MAKGLSKKTKRRHKRNLKQRRKRYTRKFTVRGGNPPDTTTAEVYHLSSCDECHYGDNLFILKFLYNISARMKERNKKACVYYNDSHVKNIKELEQYLDTDTVTLKTLKDAPQDRHKLWMGDSIDGVNYFAMEEYFNKFYIKMLNILGMSDMNIDTSLYQDEKYLLDVYKKLNETHGEKYKNVDILILNSNPKSSQLLAFNTTKMNEMCMLLRNKYKIVTTEPVDDAIISTIRDGLTMRDIGAISTSVKYIIAVHSGPFVPCYNLYTKNNVKKVILLVDGGWQFKEMNVECISNMDELVNIENHLK
jgi:hypothetical protein